MTGEEQVCRGCKWYEKSIRTYKRINSNNK